MGRSSRFLNVLLSCTVLAATWSTASRAAAHNGGIIVQLQNDKIVFGLDNEEPGGSPDLDVRVFSSLFRPILYGQDLPSFLSLATPPPGTDALPSGTNIYWDFLPMTICGVTSNLFYWDGQGTTVQDVDFGLVPQVGVTMGIYNVTDPGNSAIVDGSPEMVPGALLGVTDSTGSGLRLHRHDWFLLDDGDADPNSTSVPEGVYLIALHLRMDGYRTSEPLFVVAGTYDLISNSLASLDAAVLWTEQNVDSLILDGDYNFDGNIDEGDYATWLAQFGSTGPFPISGDFADGNRDGVVDAADYTFWRDRVGAGTVTGNTSVAIPEPPALLQFGIVALAAGVVSFLSRGQGRNYYGRNASGGKSYCSERVPILDQTAASMSS